MNPKQQSQEIQQCIQECQNVIKDMESLAQRAQNTELTSTVKESIHHLNMCISECDFASKAVQ